MTGWLRRWPYRREYRAVKRAWRAGALGGTPLPMSVLIGGE